eukprot:764526-Hanusia_phi.AAC.2
MLQGIPVASKQREHHEGIASQLKPASYLLGSCFAVTWILSAAMLLCTDRERVCIYGKSRRIPVLMIVKPKQESGLKRKQEPAAGELDSGTERTSRLDAGGQTRGQAAQSR